MRPETGEPTRAMRRASVSTCAATCSVPSTSVISGVPNLRFSASAGVIDYLVRIDLPSLGGAGLLFVLAALG